MSKGCELLHRSRWVEGLAIISHLCDEAVEVASPVDGGLIPTIWKGNHEGADDISIIVLCLGFLELNIRDVIADSILIVGSLGRKIVLKVMWSLQWRKVRIDLAVCGYSPHDT